MKLSQKVQREVEKSLVEGIKETGLKQKLEYVRATVVHQSKRVDELTAKIENIIAAKIKEQRKEKSKQLGITGKQTSALSQFK